ncbi:iron-containing alcohol dehydrogenase, partial [Vibrio parahaemolyticus]
MNRVILSPAKYVQGPHVLNDLASLVMHLGTRALVIIDKTISEKVNIDFSDSVFKKIELFSGECCYEEIERLGLLVKEKSIDVVIGVGGGKVIDSAKAISHLQNIAVVVCPTAASSDAPTSALSVVYKQSGEFLEYLPLRKNPDLVVVDSHIIAKAPTRLLVAGIGDALATYFEARVNYQYQRTTMAGGIPSLSAFTLAKLAYETL